MNEFINILKNNWEIITAVIIFILSFILQLIKKRPVSDILSDIYIAAVLAVNDTEVTSMVDPNVKGSEKLSLAVQYVVKFLKYKYPDLQITTSRLNQIEMVIESILGTPQKKGGNVDGK